MVPVTIFPVVIVSVHGQTTGLVCIGGDTSGDACPATPPAFVGSFPASEAKVNVVNSLAFNGFDISVNTDPNILNATGINPFFASEAFIIAGGTVSIVSECVNGHPTVGNCRSQDGPGVATVEVTSNVLVTSGHLYNISYRLVGSGTTPVGYQPGCSGTSNTTLCVRLFNNNMIDPENVQGATLTTGVVVGGSLVPVNKLFLLAPLIGVASVIATVAALAAVYLRRAKSKNRL